MTRLTLPVLLLLAACKGDAPEDTDTDVQVDCSIYGIDIPSVRGEIEGSYDAANGRLVIFGGNQDVPDGCAFGATDFIQDTWEYNLECGAFRQIADAGEVPSRRGRYATATDGEKLYLSGGRFRDGTSGDYTLRRDLWAFDYATDTWSRLSRGEGPSGRSNHNMVYLDGKLWVFGGNDSNNGAFFAPLNDLWVYDLAAGTWSERSFAGPAPEARLFHGMATDGDMIYVYGGGDANAFFGPFLADLWAFDPSNDTWTLMHDGVGGAQVPSDRFWANLEYDSTTNQLILFGGHDNTDLGNTNQVYSFDLGTASWTRQIRGDVYANGAAAQCDFPADFVDPDLDSPERRNAGASAMTPDGQMIIFGGKTDCGLINDVWTYTVAGGWNLESAPTEGESCLRANQNCTSLCF